MQLDQSMQSALVAKQYGDTVTLASNGTCAYVRTYVSLGMAKIEAVDDSHFMHQTVSVCHTDHPDSIVSSRACIVDLKNKFLYNRKITLL